MKAYEFTVKPENGVIPIPEELKGRITSNVKVIVLEVEPCMFSRGRDSARRKSEFLLPPTLDTLGWRFSREDTNAR